MFSITAQQAKLDLELVPNEKILEIGKTKDSILKRSKENPHFKSFKMDKRKRFKLNLEIFRDIFKIFPCVQGQDFDALLTDEEIMSFLRELRHTREINSLNDVVVDHMHQPWRTFAAFINKSLSGKTTVSTETPTIKSKRVKRPAKKSTQTSARGVVIRETPEMPLTKKKEKVMLLESMRDFHKTHPSGSGTVTKTAPSVAKIKPSVTSKGIDVQHGVLDVSEEESSEKKDNDDDKTQSDNKYDSDSEHETDESKLGSEYDHDESEENEEEEDETKITDKTKGDEDEEMDYTTSQPYDDVDIRLNGPVDTDEGFVQEEDAEIVSPLDVLVHHEVPSQQTPTLHTIPVSVITDSLPIFSTIIPQSLPFFTPPSQQSTSTPPPTTEATNPLSTLSDFASVFQFNNRVTTLEKEVVELKKDDPLKTRMTTLIDKNPDARLGATIDEFMNFLLASITTRITEQVKNQLPQILPKEVSNFAPLLEEPEFEVADLDMPQDQEENPGKNQSWLMTLASSAENPSKTFDKLISTPKDFSAFIMNHLNINNLTQETLLGPAFRLLKGTRSNYAELEYDFKECYKALLEKLDWENLKGSDYQFDLTKPLPLVKTRNRQKVPVDYFFNNDLKYLQGEISTMTYTTSLTKIKATQYDLSGIEDMVPNIWSPVKVIYDKQALWGISYWREQRKTFYVYARGLQSKHDVLFLRVGSTTLDNKVIVTLNKFKATMRETLFESANSSARATQQLSSGNSFALTVEKYTSSGITITSSGNALEYFIALTMGKCTSRGIAITRIGNVLEHFIPNNPPLNLMLHLQSNSKPVSLLSKPSFSFLTYSSSFIRANSSAGTTQQLSSVNSFALTVVEVIRKHGYGYLQEIIVIRSDNDLYRFKDGDFLRLRIIDIEDMLLLVVQNQLKNLSGDDVSDFAIALRMFTRSLVIQKRVKDL
uniref:Uncharacterized protein n=1 Tax=Tanacetum cinerariifolium TaxID=118510 RepID=A0A6L2LD08_TANCI|nr:hypothetical protein [Tanacetum cinerariifolium]